MKASTVHVREQVMCGALVIGIWTAGFLAVGSPRTHVTVMSGRRAFGELMVTGSRATGEWPIELVTHGSQVTGTMACGLQVTGVPSVPVQTTCGSRATSVRMATGSRVTGGVSLTLGIRGYEVIGNTACGLPVTGVPETFEQATTGFLGIGQADAGLPVAGVERAETVTTGEADAT